MKDESEKKDNFYLKDEKQFEEYKNLLINHMDNFLMFLNNEKKEKNNIDD